MHRFGKVILALLLCTTALSSHAVPVPHRIVLEIEALRQCESCYNDPIYQVGNKYFGFLLVDDGILEEDGLNKKGELTQFWLRIEDYYWSMNLPDPLSDFEGFRGPDGLGSSSPGFDVVNGNIVNLRGGVYGQLDTPAVDFSNSGANTFSTWLAVGLDSNGKFFDSLGFRRRSYGHFLGSLKVYRIPEPTILSLFGASVLIIVLRVPIGRRTARVV